MIIIIITFNCIKCDDGLKLERLNFSLQNQNMNAHNQGKKRDKKQQGKELFDLIKYSMLFISLISSFFFSYLASANNWSFVIQALNALQ